IITATGGTTVRDAVIKQIVYGTGTSGTALSGTVDFLYKGVTAVSSNGIQWVTAYGSNEGGCQPPAGQPATTLRCDDPVDFTGGLSAPTVMSTYSLQTIKTYVGGDTYNPPQPVYSYNLATGDSAYHQCGDARTGTSEWCTGEHVLNSITPTVYQNGVGHQLPGITFNYNGEHNYYYDSTQKVPYGNYASNTYLYYLASYHDHSNGTGEIITYQTAYNNTHGTPNSGTDNRFDPTYCYTHNTCTGSFANPGDRAWTVQVVHTVTAIGTDSSSSSLQPATTTYAYNMSIWGGTCPADSAGLTSCTGYAWYPSGEGDWQDFYHGEFHGFGIVYITSPSGDLTVEDYASTEGWGTAEGFSGNYTSGQLYEQDVYSGSTADPSRLISKTANTYAGNNSTLASCYSDSSYKAYEPCEVVLTSSRTTRYEQTGTGNINVPWVQQDNTYDDYTSSGGFGSYPQAPATGAYHNLQQQVISSSNAPTVTKKWTYDTTDTAIGGQVYYNVHQVAHSEVDDASGHVWSCQDTTYDQGVASGVPQPAAGWPTTTTSYSNCGNHAAGATLTGYIGYNGNGQGVAAVDALGVGTPGLYSSAGCTLTTAPTYINSAWTSGHYSACTVYDVQHGMPTTQTNAFGQTTTTTYDPMQGQIPKSVIDVNGQTTAMSYSYDSSGNKTEQVKAPGETGSYTNQSQIISTCTDSSTLPCLQEDSNSLQYSNAISRTFYDQQGRAVEKQTPSADGTHTIVSFTLYNDAAHTVFSSQPFTLASQNAWVDPNNYSSTPGTLTTLDALGRTVSVVDAIGNTSSMAYGLGSASGDSNTYATTTSTDANGHVTVAFTDALGRTLYTQTDKGKASGAPIPVKQTSTQYNALNLPTSVEVTDLAPQTGQKITSVTTTAQYDDLGRETSIVDPDRGTHTYNYDADGNMIGDVSGSRTLGYSYDLLGRIGCVQDAIPTLDAHGACSSGANPFVKNTYDADPGGVTWSGTNYAVGELTQSIAITYFPGPDYAQGKVTENWQHDQRGRLITSRLNMGVTGGSLAFPTFPQYQETQSYNDADQPMMTQTTVGGNNGYTFSQAYDGTTGTLTGLSNNSTGVANLATLGYNSQGLVGSVNYLTTSGTALASSALSYDGDLRPTGTTATWQGGSSLYSQNVGYDAVGNVVSQSMTQSAIPGKSGTGGSETQNFCYDEQNRLVWASNNATVPSAGNGTCGNASYQGTLGSNYTNHYVYTNLGQLWQGPLNGGSTQEQYLYCDSAHPHQLSNLSQTSSSPTCSSKGTVDYSGSYDNWGNVTSQVRGGITRTPVYDGQDHLVRWGSSINQQEEWYLYNASGERVLRRSYDGSHTT
ncbi:MAG: hypothetical protein JO215_10515, partial [Ktedonobacteraceae bacterium]|nr:hypothetical protein [Ktedonobacteraceae bacterium]